MENELKQIIDLPDPPDYRGPCVVVHGTLADGFKSTGPFPSVDIAVRWCAERRWHLAWCSVMVMEKPDEVVK